MSHCIIGAVSRVGRKGVMKVFKLGRKSPWVLTPALYYCALLAQTASPEFFYIVFVDDGCCLAHLSGSFTMVVCTRETFICYFNDQK